MKSLLIVCALNNSSAASRAFGQFQPGGARNVGNSKWFEQREVIIDHVHVSHPMLDKFVVETCSKSRADFDSKRHDPLFRAREKHQQRGTIVPRKINAVIKFLARDRGDCSKSAKAPTHDQNFLMPVIA